jgi:uncharacterized protein YecE (DUF72 family)
MLPAEIRVGTSGFSFDDWRGPVYPERVAKAQWLIHYEQQLGFDALEINYTYYQMPSHRTMASLLRKTTDAFRFTIKTHRSMTHEILQQDGSLVDHPKAFEEFRAGMRPLAESGRLGCVLAQFPYAFINTPPNRGYLDKTIDRLADLRLVVEFRHKSWVTPETLEHLRTRQVGLCVVDEPPLPRLMPWVGEATADIGYARFHGRNGEKWFGTSTAERYDYLYTDPELKELMTRSAELGKRVKTLYVYFNNCHAGSAAKNALRFKELLIEQGLLAKSSAPAPLFS